MVDSIIKRDSQKENTNIFTDVVMSVVVPGSVAAKSCSTEGGHYNTVQGKQMRRALDVLIELLQQSGNHLSSGRLAL